MRKMNRFQKDASAIAIGIFAGAMLSDYIGWQWELWALIGGVFCYITRLIFEPARIKKGFQYAWEKVSGLKLKPDWKKRVKLGFSTGIIASSFIGVFIGLCMLVFGPWHFPLLKPLIIYLIGLLAGTLYSLFCFTLSGYFIKDIENQKPESIRDMLCFNAITVHVSIPCVILWFIWQIAEGPFLFFIEEIPGFAKKCLVFAKKCLALTSLYFPVIFIPIIAFFIVAIVVLKIIYGILKFFYYFFKFVHSENMIVCGIYGVIGITIVYFFIPHKPLLMLEAAILFGVAGAGMRRLFEKLKVFEPKLIRYQAFYQTN